MTLERKPTIDEIAEVLLSDQRPTREPVETNIEGKKVEGTVLIYPDGPIFIVTNAFIASVSVAGEELQVDKVLFRNKEDSTLNSN